MSHYNQWYSETYEQILSAANWSRLTSDVPLKIALVFSWMPNVIMYHRQDRSRNEIEARLREVEKPFNGLPLCELWNYEDLGPHRESIIALFSAADWCFTKVAASKFLHFSRPRFLPMFDNQIAEIDSGEDYFRFTEETRAKLQSVENLEIARGYYPRNVLRGWDIHLMEARNERSGR